MSFTTYLETHFKNIEVKDDKYEFRHKIVLRPQICENF